MYFAVDRSQIDKIMPVLVEKMTLPQQWYALLDSAFDYEKLAFPMPINCVRIYQSEELESLAEVSPLLIHLNTADLSVLEQQLQKLLRHCSARPMLSFIQADLFADDLSQFWQNYLWVETQDDDRFLLRFADTRTLAAFGEAVPLSLWPALTQKINQWLIVNREGAIENLLLPVKRTLITEQIKLTQKEYSALIDAAQADSIIDWLAENMSEIVPRRNKFQFYQQVESACLLARRHNLLSFTDQVSLAIASVLSYQQVLAAPELKIALQNGAVGEALNAVLLSTLPQVMNHV